MGGSLLLSEFLNHQQQQSKNPSKSFVFYGNCSSKNFPKERTGEGLPRAIKEMPCGVPSYFTKGALFSLETGIANFQAKLK